MPLLSLSGDADLDQAPDRLGSAGDDRLLASPVVNKEQPLVGDANLQGLHAFVAHRLRIQEGD